MGEFNKQKRDQYHENMRVMWEERKKRKEERQSRRRKKKEKSELKKKENKKERKEKESGSVMWVWQGLTMGLITFVYLPKCYLTQLWNLKIQKTCSQLSLL